MDKKLIEAINSLEIGETLNVKIKCVDDTGENCKGCIFSEENCNSIDCWRDEEERKYIVEL